MQTIYQQNSNTGGRRSGSDRRVFADPDYKGIERRITEDRRKNKNKRKHPRFRSKDVTFIKLKSEHTEDVGQLIDISKGGLSVRCFLKEEISHDYTDLGIFSSSGDFSIDGISFKTVSDIELNNKIPFSLIIMRRYSVQYEELKPDQIEKLDYFLLNYTILNGLD